MTLAVVLMGQVTAQRRPPNYSLDDMPETNFDCSDKIEGGYYADPEADCQMFHVCVRMPGNDVQDYRFLCPNDTMFDQENRICANWFDIDCEAAAVYYGNSFDLYRLGSSGNVDQTLSEIVASPSPIISLGPSTARPLGLNNRPRTSGTGYYSNRRNGPRNSFETNSADDESLVRSATGDQRLQRAEEAKQAESEGDFDSYEEAPKRRTSPKKKVALRKFSRNRPTEGDDGSYTKGENSISSSSKAYISSTTAVPTTERTNFNSFRSNGYNGFSRNGGNRNAFVSSTAASTEQPTNAQQFNNDYRSSNQQQGGNFNFQQRQYNNPSTAAAGTTLGYKAPSPTTTASPSPASFSGNYQNYQRPPSRPSAVPTASAETYPTPTTFSPTTRQNNNYNFNSNNFNRNSNNFDRTNPAPTTYSPPTSRQNNYNTFNSNDNTNYQKTNPVPTTYSPATSKSTNYNPYTANFNNNYNAQTTTTIAPSSSDYNSFRTNNFQRNTYNSFSTNEPPTTYSTTTVAPTSRRQPFNNRRTFQSPAPFQVEDDEKESLKTAQSANFGSNDEYLSSNTFRGAGNKAQNNYTKNYYSTTVAPSSYQTNDRTGNRVQAGNTETTAAYTGRNAYKFALNNNDQTDSGFSVSTTLAPVTRGSSNYRASSTYSNPSSQSVQQAPSTRANNGFTNRAPVTTVPPQNTITNVNTLARGNKPEAPPQDKIQPQPQVPGTKGQQKGGEAYDYAYYDDSAATYDYEGFEAEAEAHFGKTNKASKVTPSVPGN